MRSLWLSVVAVVLVGCGGGAPQPGTLSSRWAAPAILSHVPADTPYLIALLEPLNEELRRRMMQGFDDRLVEQLRTLDQTPGFDGSKSEPWIRVAKALASELQGKDPKKWGEQLGFDPRGRFVLYGLSAWPVVRIEISNPARLRSTVERVLSAAGLQPQQRRIDGHAYWVAGGAQVSFVAAVLDREAVAALVPTILLDATLPLVLGMRAPDASLAATTTVPDMLSRHRFLANLLVYFDAHNIVEILSGAKPSALDVPLRAAVGAVAPACRADLDRLVAIAPRVVLGYRRLDDKRFEASAVIETTPGVVGALRKLRAPAPEVTTQVPGHPLFAMGAAVDPRELVGWLHGVTRELHDHPFSCPWFLDINHTGRQLAQKLDDPLPPTWLGVRGFSLVVDDATLLPPNIAGHVVVTGDRVADLVSSLAGTSPQFAGIPLIRDGRPVALPYKQLRLPVSSAHLALTTDRLVIAAGENSAGRAAEHLATPAPKSSPLMMMAFDLPRLQKLLASFGQPQANNFGSVREVGMSLDVVDAGISFDIWGSWGPLPPAAPGAERAQPD
jgi:hypothetical protein